jgi:hypothetical protein
VLEFYETGSIGRLGILVAELTLMDSLLWSDARVEASNVVRVSLRTSARYAPHKLGVDRVAVYRMLVMESISISSRYLLPAQCQRRLIVYSPQIYENYTRKSGEGLSIAFVITWLLGDLFSLAGALIAGLIPTVILLALYVSDSTQLPVASI